MRQAYASAFANNTTDSNPTIGKSQATTQSGMLTVTGVTDTLMLIGQYSMANFISGSDAFGGTTVIDPPVTTSAALA